jgi:hypothetical protein
MEEEVRLLCVAAMITTVIIFIGLGGLRECSQEHEIKIKCIEKTGNPSCDPAACDDPDFHQGEPPEKVNG